MDHQKINPAEELMERAEEVLAFLDSGAGPLAASLSSPLLNSKYKRQKGFHFPEALCVAVEQYADDKRLNQKDVFQAALVEFLQRRGAEYIEHALELCD